MGYKDKTILTDKNGDPIPQIWDPALNNFTPYEGRVTLSGTIMEIYGATIANRPNANSVPIGATYMAVNSQEVWQSNGADWVVM